MPTSQLFSGYCFGSNVGISSCPTAEDCLRRCKQNDACEWFTFQSDEKICSLTSDCKFVDETCGETCVHGPKNCQAEDDGESLVKSSICVPSYLCKLEQKSSCIITYSRSSGMLTYSTCLFTFACRKKGFLAKVKTKMDSDTVSVLYVCSIGHQASHSSCPRSPHTLFTLLI